MQNQLSRLSMALQLNRSVFSILLLLSLSYCHGKNVSVQVIGLIHCKDCFSHEFASNPTSQGGTNIFIHCTSGKKEMNTLGNGPVDQEGKFNMTISTNMITKLDCFAELQRQSTLSCPIQSPQSASFKFLHTEYHNNPINLKFFPGTCQSDFFCLPHPKNFTFPYTQPPPPEANPPENSAPSPSPASKPSYPPPTPAPEFQSPEIPPTNAPTSPNLPKPNPPPVSRQLPRTPPKAFHQAPSPQSPIPPKQHKDPRSQTPTAPPTEYAPSPSPASGPISKPLPKSIPPPVSKQLPKPAPKAFHRTPSVQSPISSPTPPPSPKEAHSRTPIATPIAPIPPPRNQRKFNPIPRAPPVPKLPSIPPVPRKYFNPIPRSQPPHPSSSFYRF